MCPSLHSGLFICGLYLCDFHLSGLVAQHNGQGWCLSTSGLMGGLGRLKLSMDMLHSQGRWPGMMKFFWGHWSQWATVRSESRDLIAMLMSYLVGSWHAHPFSYCCLQKILREERFILIAEASVHGGLAPDACAGHSGWNMGWRLFFISWDTGRGKTQ